MIVVKTLDEIENNPNTVITIGTFDGIHKGHRKIINELITRAEKTKARKVLITFEPHPREIVGRGPTQLLTTLKERINILSEFDIDITFVVNFTFEFSRLPYDEFYKNYVYNGIGVKEVIIGYDHMFGRDREANIEQIKELGKIYNFTIDSIPPVSVDGEIVNSSLIRDILMRGDVCHAEKLLGRYYSLHGKIITGDKRGTILGFPTANVAPDSDRKLIPAEGVYLVRVSINEEKYFGMLNIGVRPTFYSQSNKVIEFHLFGFSKDIYDQTVKIDFIQRLRSEMKFESKEELIKRLNIDKIECEKIINQLTKY